MEGNMKLDDAILEELERGKGTVKQIGERLAARVQDALYRLIESEKVVPSGYPGKGNEKSYSLPPQPSIKRRV
jgi:hypothetical protein